MREHRKEADGVEVFAFCSQKRVEVGCFAEIEFTVKNDTDRRVECELICALPHGMRFIRGDVKSPCYCYPLLRLGRIILGDLACGQIARICILTSIICPPTEKILHCSPYKQCSTPAFFVASVIRYKKERECHVAKTRESNIIVLIFD